MSKADTDLTLPQNRYFNREMSLLQFNRRVLAQAEDKQVPLLERLKFLCIVSSNMDEFFEVRVGGVKQKLNLGSEEVSLDGRSIRQLDRDISQEAQALVKRQYEVLNQEVLPALDQEKVRLINAEQLSDKESEWLRDYFLERVLPVLSPIALDPARPFPMLLNKALNFIVQISGHDAFKRKTNLAIIPIPRSLPRVIQIPNDMGQQNFVTLATVVLKFRELIFPDIDIKGCYSFRVTRNSDLFLDEEEVDDLLHAVKGKLLTRNFGEAVRLETSAEFPEDLKDYLLEEFNLGEADHFRVRGPVNLHRLFSLFSACDRPDLKYLPFKPQMPNALKNQEDYFSVLSQRDVLIHHPYQSFACVLEFLRQAAEDPNVVAIKQTLYRTEADSPIIDALVKAAQNGKDVTVIVELMARFDEERNVKLAARLHAAGVHVLYGVVGFKTHAKACMIIRQEDERLRRYAHLGTGNYHPGTAKLYTDYGLFTSHAAITQDLHQMFLQLSSLAPHPKSLACLQAPFNLQSSVMEKIARCEKLARKGKPTRIIAKFNSLTDRAIIDALYQASQAGVSIELIIRGICCLRPQVKGLSDNITVRSVIGRFLEHTRVYYFDYGDGLDVYLSSADWMERNLYHRVEVAFPILLEKNQHRIKRNLDFALGDESAWLLQTNGSYIRAKENYSLDSTLQRHLLRIHTRPV